MLTDRDVEILGWIGRLGAADAEHVMRRFGLGRSQAHARLSILTAHGLLDRRALLHRRPALYLASHAGLRFCGLQSLGVCRVSAGGFEHASQAAAAAVALGASLPGWRLLSDREIRAVEREQAAPLASAKLGELNDGRSALHRPDLALIAPDGRVLAVEVELSIKAPRRLAAICRGWARARHITHTYYFAPPTVAQAVGRAVAREHAQERISVLALGDFELPSRTALTEEINHAGHHN